MGEMESEKGKYMNKGIIRILSIAMITGMLADVARIPVLASINPNTQTNDEIETEDTSLKEFEEDVLVDSFEEDNLSDFAKLAEEYMFMALTYKESPTYVYSVDDQNLNNEEDIIDSSIEDELESGITLYPKDVIIKESETAGNRKRYYLVTYYDNGIEKTGYVAEDDIVFTNEKWIEWIEQSENIKTLSENNLTTIYDNSSSDSIEAYEDVSKFPISYQSALNTLKNKHTNWTFVPVNTKLDFNTAVSKEMGDKSWIYVNDTNKKKGFVGAATGQTNWAYATAAGVSYYMDPRNYLDETHIFAFEQLTYNSSYHTESSVQNFLNGTFMKGTIPGEGMTYARAFYTIGSNRKLSPTHLASRVYQEQGAGTSPLISGTYSGYTGYYNYFNVGATGSTSTDVIVNGLAYAKSKGWNTRYKSLEGGAATIGNNYVLKGQDTIYLEKFNVAPGAANATYTHQYMQNIQAPYTEGASTYKIYSQAGSLGGSFVFKIPVYNNMPNEVPTPTPTPKPTPTPTPTPPPMEEDPIKSEFYVEAVPNQTYTGATIKPSVNVYYIAESVDESGKKVTNNILLTCNTDYKVTYANNKNPGTKDNATVSKRPTISVTGKGNYSGVQKVYFTIEAKGMTSENTNVSDMTVTATGKVIKSSPTVTVDGRKLKKGTDYTLSYPVELESAYISAGSWPVIITGKGGYKGSVTVYETITPNILMSKASIATISNQKYDAEIANSAQGISPRITVKYKGRILTDSRDTEDGQSGDYKVAYENNRAVGTAKAIITAEEGSDFIGSKTVTFKITGTSIAKAKIRSSIKDVDENGNEIYIGKGITSKSYSPEAKDMEQKDYELYIGNTVLVRSEDGINGDYVVSYKNVAKCGTASIIFRGINGYTGTLAKTYKINQVKLTDTENISVDVAISESYTYMQGGIKPLPEVTVNYVTSGQSVKLKNGMDYTLSYKNNTRAYEGDVVSKLPVVTISGRGNYRGNINKTFTIVKSDFTDIVQKRSADDDGTHIVIDAPDVVYSKKPGGYKSKPVITAPNGKKLTAGTDYKKSCEYFYAQAVDLDGDGKADRSAGTQVDPLDIVPAGTLMRVTVTGAGENSNYTAGATSCTYRITKKAITSTSIKSYVGTRIYTGTSILPDYDKVWLCDGVSVLEAKKDYEIVAYGENIKTGKGTVIVRGVGDYGGYRTLTFKIKARGLLFK